MHVRGSVLALARREAAVLRAEGRLDLDRLRGALAPADLALLESPAEPEEWVPAAACDRLILLLAEAVGGPPPEVLVRHGRRLAGAFLDRPIFHALAAQEPRPHPVWWRRQGHLLVTVPSSLFSHSSWRLVPEDEPGRFAIEVTEADELPDSAVWCVQGGLEALAASLAGRDVRVASERPERGRIVYQGRPALA